MAVQFGTPITPVSMVGSFEFNRKTSWRLRRSRVIVYLHDTIETNNLGKHGWVELRDKVHAIVSAPVNANYEGDIGAGQSLVSEKLVSGRIAR
jgi:hypothetical protein